MNDERNHESRNDQHAETAAEEVFDEVESAETRLPDDRRDTDDGEAGDTLTPSPTAQEDIHRDIKRGKA